MKTFGSTTFFISLFLISMLGFSCDPGYRHNKIIVNDSDYDLLVTVYQDSTKANEPYLQHSFLVSKHTQLDIMSTDGLGSTQPFESCSTYSDSIRTEIAGNDSLHLAIDLGNQSNWIYSLLKKTFKGGGQCECRIQIRNEHIQ
jgi:hypothetical protein